MEYCSIAVIGRTKGSVSFPLSGFEFRKLSCGESRIWGSASLFFCLVAEPSKVFALVQIGLEEVLDGSAETFLIRVEPRK